MAAKVPITSELPLWLQLKKVSMKYMDALSARLNHLGIDRHYFLIVAIGEGGGKLTQQDLADLLEVDKVSMVGIIDYLSKIGFVRRTASKSDKRKHLIMLTPAGERSIPEIKKTIADLNQKALSGLPDSLSAVFPFALASMKSALEKEMERTERKAPVKGGSRKKSGSRAD